MARLGIISSGGPKDAFVERLEQLLGEDVADIAAAEAGVPMHQLAFEGRDEELVRKLASPLEDLAQAGADCALLASVSAHCVQKALADAGTLPLLDLAEALRQDVLAQGWRSVFLLGSYRTMKDGFLKRPLILSHTIVITPNEEEKLWLQHAVDAVQGGTGEREEMQEHLLEIVSKGREEGAQGLLLASTALETLAEGLELPLPAAMPSVSAAHAFTAFRHV